MIVAVEQAGFLDAATSLRDANHAAADLHRQLSSDLAATAGMAGDDATATEFAAAYDAAAGEALAGVADLTAACATLGRLTAQSWDNHARAEARSILPGRVVAQPCTAAPEGRYVGVLATTPPSSLGGDPPALTAHEAWVLDHIEAFVWPDADVDRLRSAAGRWRAGAGSLNLVAAHVVRATAAWDTQRSPEAVLAVAALTDLHRTTDDLAASVAALASHCDGYAAAVEQKRAEIIGLVREILLMVVEGMVLGALLVAMTAGAGAGVSTAAVVARVSSQTPRFAALLAALRATTSGIAGSVRTTHAALQLRRARLDRFLGLPLRTSSFGGRSLGSAQRLRYAASPKHHPQSRGGIASAPLPGQEALDFSLPVRSTTTRRVSVDPGTGRFVVFDETTAGVFHGHVRTWDELTHTMQSVLRKAGVVDRRGRIIDEGYL